MGNLKKGKILEWIRDTCEKDEFEYKPQKGKGVHVKFKDLHKNIKIRIITGFFQRSVSQMIIPFMTIYLAGHFGVTVAGILMFIAIVSGILISFYGGYFADIKGRKPLLLISEFGNFLVFLGMAFSNSSWYLLPLATYFLFILNNLLVNLSKPALDAMIIDLSTPETRKTIYSINYWTINLSFAIGALVGAIFYNHYLFEVLLTAAFITLIIFFVFYFYIDESKPAKVVKDNASDPHIALKNIFTSYKFVFRNNLFLKFFFVSLLIMSLEFQLANYISVRLAGTFASSTPFSSLGFDYQISGVEMYGILRAENTIGVLIFALTLERFLKRLSNTSRLYFGTALFTLGYIVLGFSNEFVLLIVIMALLTLGEIIYIPIQQTLLSVIIDEDHRTKYLAIYGLHQRIGLMIASLFVILGGYLTPYFISFVYGCIGISILLLYRQILKERDLGPEFIN